jgi:ribosomal protein S18 acetylase RimI-like enzyme
VIRRATPTDFQWIRDTAADVYRALGDYGTIIPSWLDHPGVLAFVDQGADARVRRGFMLVGFYAPHGLTDWNDEACVADLLAIAVEPSHQRRGIGRALLDYALDISRAASANRPVPEIRLTVAEGNTAALALFARAGFAVMDHDYGNYDGGQRAIRMRRPL